MKSHSLLDIVYEDIKEVIDGKTFGRINYHGYHTLIITSDEKNEALGYVNASIFCRDLNKRDEAIGQRAVSFQEWLEDEYTKDKIEYITEHFDIRVPLIIDIKSKNEANGIYIHNQLLVSVGMYISCQFGELVFEIITQHHITEDMTKKIKEKDDEIKRLEDMRNKMIKERNLIRNKRR